VILWRIAQALFSGQLFREVNDLFKIRRHGENLIIFYSSGWTDEVYVRSSVKACIAKGLNAILVVSEFSQGSAREEVNICCFSVNPRFLKYTKASILITASTGIDPKFIPDSCFEVIHMPHSLVSMNMVYGPGAFDAFTTFFVCGDYQAEEIYELDVLQGRKPRSSCVVGYGKSDIILDWPESDTVESGLVLIAPSWGPAGFIETIGLATISALLESGIRVCLRPHPRYMKHSRDLIDQIVESFSHNPNFYLEDPLSVSKSMHSADVLVSDYSGAAFEYIFTKRRPVIFVDVALKKMNPRFELCEKVPVEISWRDKLGIIVSPFPEEILTATRRLLGNEWGDDFIIDQYFEALAWDGGCGNRVAEQLSLIIRNNRTTPSC
jgi:hypothetical protein